MSASQRVTRFRNPSNGYEENVGEAWLWCLLARTIYFAAKGICFHAATSLLLAIGTGGISWFIYPFFANWSVRKHYLRNGWVPEKDEPRDTDAKSNRGEPGAGSTLFDTLFITAVTAAGAIAGNIWAKDAPDPGTTRGVAIICAGVGFAAAYLLTKLRGLSSWRARRTYRRGTWKVPQVVKAN